jgi:hypothetical protein
MGPGDPSVRLELKDRVGDSVREADPHLHPELVAECNPLRTGDEALHSAGAIELHVTARLNEDVEDDPRRASIWICAETMRSSPVSRICARTSPAD